MYLFSMHDRILDVGFFDRIAQDPERQISVEVACALEGLNDAYAVAVATHDGRADRYRLSICAGVEYLLALQCTRSESAREIGGFGMSLRDRAQRIDVTGHAASVFLKALANGVATEGSARRP
jgi:hypothetical protein